MFSRVTIVLAGCNAYRALLARILFCAPRVQIDDSIGSDRGSRLARAELLLPFAPVL